MKSLERLLIVKSEPHLFLQFFRVEHLLTLITLPSRPLWDGIVLSMEVIFSNLKDSITFAKFLGEGQHSKISMDDSSVTVRSNATRVKKSSVSISLNLENQFINFTNVIAERTVTVYTNKEVFTRIPFKLMQGDNFRQCFLFKQRSKSNYCVHIQLEQISVFRRLQPQELDSSTISSLQSTLVHYRATSFQESSLPNHAPSDFGPAFYFGHLIPHLSRFSTVFLASRGLEFLLFRFTRFKYQDADPQVFVTSLISKITAVLKGRQCFLFKQR
jgi:hypothetical protein